MELFCQHLTMTQPIELLDFYYTNYKSSLMEHLAPVKQIQ